MQSPHYEYDGECMNAEDKAIIIKLPACSFISYNLIFIHLHTCHGAGGQLISCSRCQVPTQCLSQLTGLKCQVQGTRCQEQGAWFQVKVAGSLCRVPDGYLRSMCTVFKTFTYQKMTTMENGGLRPPDASNSTEFTFFPLLILVGVSYFCQAQFQLVIAVAIELS